MRKVWGVGVAVALLAAGCSSGDDGADGGDGGGEAGDAALQVEVLSSPAQYVTGATPSSPWWRPRATSPT